MIDNQDNERSNPTWLLISRRVISRAFHAHNPLLNQVVSPSFLYDLKRRFSTLSYLRLSIEFRLNLGL